MEELAEEKYDITRNGLIWIIILVFASVYFSFCFFWLNNEYIDAVLFVVFCLLVITFFAFINYFDYWESMLSGMFLGLFIFSITIRVELLEGVLINCILGKIFFVMLTGMCFAMLLKHAIEYSYVKKGKQ